MSRPKGQPENMISSGAAYALANSFKNEAELYRKKFEQSEKERDHYKELAEAAAEVIRVFPVAGQYLNTEDKEKEQAYLKYQALKTQSPE